MELLIGAVLALSIGLFATFFGLDRDRAFYPTLMIVIALYYALFAVMGGSAHALMIESIVIVAFLGVSIAGFKTSLWLVVAALAAHGLFDFFHGQLIANPGVPTWWPPFCGSADIVFAAYLAWLLSRLDGQDRHRRTGSGFQWRKPEWKAQKPVRCSIRP